MTTYMIVRYYQNHPSEIVTRHQTLEQAKEHCNDPETNSKTCNSEHGNNRTHRMGPWFDGYTEE